MISIFNEYGKINVQEQKNSEHPEKGGAVMKGTRENLGMKEGTKSKGRSVGRVTTGKGLSATTGKKIGHLESGHGTLQSSRTTGTRKSGTK
ncbi:hypothetical protein [Geobacter sp. AOG1]|uniref:hypothetical protein n=1 Tax=Geobacter sp. AOG1 TaxID=1566346 RepID=UPI001CC48ACB|nr:hypothetical protein [Geobacter sp. AOG1]